MPLLISLGIIESEIWFYLLFLAHNYQLNENTANSC